MAGDDTIVEEGAIDNAGSEMMRSLIPHLSSLPRP